MDWSSLTLRLGHEWKLEELPPQSIALDGAVQGPKMDPEQQRYSFDHHGGCVRLLTSATCLQVLDAMLVGLDPEAMTLYVNDVDGDVVLSVWLLLHHDRWRTPELLARVRPLVISVAGADAHGPVYPTLEHDLTRHFYRVIMGRTARSWDSDDQARQALLDAAAHLEAWWVGGLITIPEPPSTTAALRLSEHATWVFAEAEPEDGAAPPLGSRTTGLYQDGWHRLVIAQPSAGGRTRYLVAKRSDLVPDFPLPTLFDALNHAEASARGGPLGAGQTWGGGSTVGGSPRDGSVLAASEVATVIEATLGDWCFLAPRSTSQPRRDQIGLVI